MKLYNTLECFTTPYDYEKLYSLLMSDRPVIFRAAGLKFSMFWHRTHEIYYSFLMLSKTVFSNHSTLQDKMKTVRENIVAVDSSSDNININTFNKLYDVDYLKNIDKIATIIITVDDKLVIAEITSELLEQGFLKENILHLNDFVLPNRTSLNYID